MEHDRGTKIIAVVALVVAIIGLSLGFAAFTKNLQISSGAKVNPTDSFSVKFSSSSGQVEKNPIQAKAGGVGGASGENANIDPDNTISNLKGTFTTPGQNVTYEFYVHNDGDYDAFLKSVTYANANDGGSFAKCTAGVGTTKTLVEEACSGFEVTVDVNNEDEEENNHFSTTNNQTPIKGHKLGKGKSEKVIVKIEYKTDATRADGDFTVDFGNITLLYSTTDESN